MTRLRLIALVVAFAVASVPLLESFPCDRQCPGDSAADDCVPGCDDCACCPLVRVVLQRVVAAAPIEQVSALLEEPLRRPPVPGPIEILHVPKLSVA